VQQGLLRPCLHTTVLSLPRYTGNLSGIHLSQVRSSECFLQVSKLVITFAVGRGTVEEPRGSHKFYTLSAVHQLHCLVSNGLTVALLSLGADPNQWSIQQELHLPERNDEQHPRHRHSRHCVDYLRQSLMCAADHTLEPVDPELGGVTGWGVKRTCRDWAKMKSWAEDRRASNAQGFGDAL
jgi:hypothetical protein